MNLPCNPAAARVLLHSKSEAMHFCLLACHNGDVFVMMIFLWHSCDDNGA